MESPVANEAKDLRVYSRTKAGYWGHVVYQSRGSRACLTPWASRKVHAANALNDAAL
jgi:hypothetical protein